MLSMYEIIPGILEQEWSEIEKKLVIIKRFTHTVHIDLLDGKFAPNTTWLDPTPFAKYSKEFFLELHMMVEEPIGYVDSWADAGVKRFIGQAEKMHDQEAFVDRVKKRKAQVGLAVDVQTKPEAIVVPYEKLDFLFAMTVKAGFSHQSFLPDCLAKVRFFREKTTLPIEVDGGINDKTIILAKNAGATRFISTGFLFKSDDPAEKFAALSSCLDRR